MMKGVPVFYHIILCFLFSMFLYLPYGYTEKKIDYNSVNVVHSILVAKNSTGEDMYCIYYKQETMVLYVIFHGEENGTCYGGYTSVCSAVDKLVKKTKLKGLNIEKVIVVCCYPSLQNNEMYCKSLCCKVEMITEYDKELYVGFGKKNGFIWSKNFPKERND